MKIFEYALLKLDEDGDPVEITLRSEVLADNDADARVKIGVRLGAAGLNPNDYEVVVRPFW